MNAYELKKLVSDGKPFAVCFIKKDKTARTMICHTGNEDNLRGGPKAYNAEAKDLLTVFDIEEQDYRTINCKTIQALVIGKTKYATINGTLTKISL